MRKRPLSAAVLDSAEAANIVKEGSNGLVRARRADPAATYSPMP
jgi:hypothetical protein